MEDMRREKVARSTIEVRKEDVVSIDVHLVLRLFNFVHRGIHSKLLCRSRLDIRLLAINFA
jgi:hypothetical protein